MKYKLTEQPVFTCSLPGGLILSSFPWQLRHCVCNLKVIHLYGVLTVCSGVQRSTGVRGDCLIGCPLPNPSIEQWRMVVTVVPLHNILNALFTRRLQSVTVMYTNWLSALSPS